jgi:hypothetical protein
MDGVRRHRFLCVDCRETRSVFTQMSWRAHNTILIGGEEIAAAFERLRFPNDPDKMLAQALAGLAEDNAPG